MWHVIRTFVKSDFLRIPSRFVQSPLRTLRYFCKVVKCNLGYLLELKLSFGMAQGSAQLIAFEFVPVPLFMTEPYQGIYNE